MSAPDQVENRDSRRLWSLLDMLKDNAAAFIEMGEQITAARMLWSLKRTKDAAGNFVLTDEGKERLGVALSRLLELARRLKLPTSMRLIGRRLGYPA